MIEMHSEIVEKKRKKRQSNLKSQRSVTDVNFDVGDYVLVSTGLRTPAGKLSPTWSGPFVVVKVISDWIFKVRHLLTTMEQDVHSRRIRFYEDSSLGITEDIKDFIQDSTQSYEIEGLSELRNSDDGLEVLVSWRGFEPHERTWENLDQISAAAPKMVKEFLDSLPKSSRKKFSFHS
jgi:hypothetical protein